MKSITVISIASAMLFFVACDRFVSGDNGENEYKPIVLNTRSQQFVRDGQGFAAEFIQKINSETEKDYIISPLSMQFLLGMILDGAKGETADEICNVLGYGKGEIKAVNEYCHTMLKALPTLDKQTKLSIANAIFVDEGWPLRKAYKSDMASYYDATIENLDFGDSDNALRRINGWANQQTNGMVPKVLDEVSKDMLAYLLNALYFKSKWSSVFQKSMSFDRTFTDESGKAKTLKMMRQSGDFRYCETGSFQALTLPYGNGAFSMTVLLPFSGHKVADICASLASDGLSFMDNARTEEVDVWLPRFETKFGIKLNDILSGMGMPRAFDDKLADFTGMSEYALCLSFVRQDAAIKVDEEGTEAAAVSSAGMMKNTSIGPGKTVVFHADHPFLYLITEKSTGAILFAGRFASN